MLVVFGSVNEQFAASHPFKKSHMAGHHLIFDNHKKKIFEMYLILDFDMKVFELKFDMKMFRSHLI